MNAKSIVTLSQLCMTKLKSISLDELFEIRARYRDTKKERIAT
jgi:hypothetical protein